MQRRLIRTLASLLATLFVFAPTVLAQQPTPTPPAQADEVIRVTSELVQTDITVVDKQGSLVNGLKREQFELRVDKKPRPILFFEQVKAGSATEEAQLAAARGVSAVTKTPAAAPDRGRTVFFYFDDFHLGTGSMDQGRKMVARFIEREMGQNDEIAIGSATGQVGFLQQLTDNKAVLRLALQRLRARPFTVSDGQRPPMTEHQALLIENNDPGVLGFFVEQLLKEMPGVTNPEEWVKGRARQILEQANYATSNTLTTLDSLVGALKNVPGRKLLFFISDGFSLDTRRSGYLKLRLLTAQAAKSGVVIYSIDARGLIASLSDASTPLAADPTGRLAKAEMGAISESQDALNAIARDTGGRAFFNNNDLSIGVTKAIKETSNYYLIAWHPETEDQRSGKFNRIEITVIGRPDLVVRLRKTFTDKELSAAAAKNPPKDRTPAGPKQTENNLRAAIKSAYPPQAIATSLNLGFLDSPETGPSLAVTMQVTLDPQSFAPAEKEPAAHVDLGGVVYDTSGKVAGSFQTQMTVKGAGQEQNSSLPDNASYNHLFRLKPGLYQVRVAARDVKDGRLGSARQWIEIPDLSSRKLALSSLILAKRSGQLTAVVKQGSGIVPADLSIDHQFERTTNLRFVTFVYNAAVGPNAGNGRADGHAGSGNPQTQPDVAIQVQVLRDKQPVITSPLRRIEIHSETDLARVPYAAELPLADLPPGRYLLQVTVIDRIARTSATNDTSFIIN